MEQPKKSSRSLFTKVALGAGVAALGITTALGVQKYLDKEAACASARNAVLEEMASGSALIDFQTNLVKSSANYDLVELGKECEAIQKPSGKIGCYLDKVNGIESELTHYSAKSPLELGPASSVPDAFNDLSDKVASAQTSLGAELGVAIELELEGVNMEKEREDVNNKFLEAAAAYDEADNRYNALETVKQNFVWQWSSCRLTFRDDGSARPCIRGFPDGNWTRMEYDTYGKTLEILDGEIGKALEERTKFDQEMGNLAKAHSYLGASLNMNGADLRSSADRARDYFDNIFKPAAGAGFDALRKAVDLELVQSKDKYGLLSDAADRACNLR
jgi:hypothetical protein